MSGVLGGCGEYCSPLISQAIANVSLITHVNTAGDPRHVVTLVGLVVKIAILKRTSEVNEIDICAYM